MCQRQFRRYAKWILHCAQYHCSDSDMVCGGVASDSCSGSFRSVTAVSAPLAVVCPCWNTMAQSGQYHCPSGTSEPRPRQKVWKQPSQPSQRRARWSKSWLVSPQMRHGRSSNSSPSTLTFGASTATVSLESIRVMWCTRDLQSGHALSI